MIRITIYILYSVFLLYVIFPATTSGQSSKNFHLKKWSISSIVGTSASANLKLKESALGGLAIGNSSSSSFVLNGGMFITSLKDTFLIRNSFPEWFILKQNYPNPFNPSTTIVYSLPKASDVKLRIYNALGQTVKLINMGHQPAGHHQIRWNGTDDSGNPVSNGIYFYQIVTKDFFAVKKMILVK